jgi:hypothetical protein
MREKVNSYFTFSLLFFFCRLPEEDMLSFDSTGMFYFTPSRSIEEAVLVRHDFFHPQQNNKQVRLFFGTG